jgi:hypothetical protein
MWLCGLQVIHLRHRREEPALARRPRRLRRTVEHACNVHHLSSYATLPRVAQQPLRLQRLPVCRSLLLPFAKANFSQIHPLERYPALIPSIFTPQNEFRAFLTPLTVLTV